MRVPSEVRVRRQEHDESHVRLRLLRRQEGEGRGGGTDDLDTIGSRWVRRPAS